MNWKRQIGISFGISLLAGGLAVVSFDTPQASSAPPRKAQSTKPQPRWNDSTVPPPAAPLSEAPWNPTTDEPDITEGAFHPPAPAPPALKPALLAPPQPSRGPHASLRPPGRLQGPSSPRSAPIDTKLSEIRAAPLGWLAKRVRIDVQLDRTAASPPQAIGAFSGAGWSAVHAWPDEVFTWYPAVYRNPAPYLFVSADSPLAAQLADMPRFTRLRIVAVVRELFLSEPWIEIEAVEELDGFVNEGSILHVGRAIDLLREGSIAMALDQLERARSAPLPEHALSELERLEEAAREVLREAGLENR